MAVPQNKVTRSRRNKRRSHDAIFPDSSMECPDCGELKRPHHVCAICGNYNGRSVISMELDEDDAE